MIIGVLALQGAFSEHINALNRIENVSAVEVKTAKSLETIDALIIPGGESTAMALSAQRNNLIEPLQSFIKSGKPVWGTCAGMIMLSNNAHNIKQGGQALLGGLDVTVKRNAFGHQIDSFTTPMKIDVLGGDEFLGVFIRAPIIESLGKDVEIIATLPERDNVVVAVRQGPILATAFHPELTRDERFHRYFCSFVKN
ncbi:glutamine amidotransferase subunit pdxT [Globomyces pollinis-pini]|nr:glutamine amidotransferase subunit pdxT [Globomyces pollinis-pini]